MLLTINEIDPTDVGLMFCTDSRLADEIAAVNRSIQRLDETVATWLYVDPHESPAGGDTDPVPFGR